MGLTAIFGGTFNPFHIGHYEMLRALQLDDSIEKILVMPDKIPPHKSADELASAASLIMGQADEGLPVVIISGFGAFNHLRDEESNIDPLLRPKEFDVFRK